MFKAARRNILASIKIGHSIDGNQTLWRYMSIDKLVNILETKSLYFSPLSSYANSDPFEGYLPKVALEAFSSVFNDSLERLNSAYSNLLEIARNLDSNAAENEKIKRLREDIDKQPEIIKESYRKIIRGVTVSCWHTNSHESEAMWKLYSD